MEAKLTLIETVKGLENHTFADWSLPEPGDTLNKEFTLEGGFQTPPKVGWPFQFQTYSHDWLITSKVVRVKGGERIPKKGEILFFMTKNSLYQLERIG